MCMLDVQHLCRGASASGMRSSALPAFHSTSLAKASDAVGDVMRRLCDDVAEHLSTSGSCASPDKEGAVGGDAASSSGDPATGQPFDIIPLIQRTTMAAAFERTFGIPFPDSVRPSHPQTHASHALTITLRHSRRRPPYLNNP